MSTEMRRLEHARPQVAPPTPETRAQARERLRAAILTEAPQARIVSQTPQARIGRAPRRVKALNVTAFVWVAGSASALIVAVAALVLLHHGPAAPRHAAVTPATGPAGASGARGAIVGRNGVPLAGVAPRYDVKIVVGSLPTGEAAREAEFNRIEQVLGGHPDTPTTCQITTTRSERLGSLECLVARQQARRPRAIVVIADKTAAAVRPITAHPSDFPGVELVPKEVRAYPQGDLAAQMLGTVGPITAQEVREPAYHGISPDAVIGQSGLEADYDTPLREGDTLHTNIDVPLQRAGERSLAKAIAGNRPATGGAFVVMDPRDGSILAMGSAPTFDPSVFTAPISRSRYRALFGQGSGEPQFNRAIASAGPVESIFTPLTALAAMNTGVWSPTATYDDTGTYCFPGTTTCLRNRQAYAGGRMNVLDAIRSADDVFFDNLGYLMNADLATRPNDGPLQQWAAQFGVGNPTGIDLPGEASGFLPSPRSLAMAAHSQRVRWTVADNAALAVGQGDLAMTPVQVAVAYAAIANGGTIVVPHIGQSVTKPDGSTFATVDPQPRAHIPLEPKALSAVRAGLRQAARTGTAAGVFANFPQQVYAKTGTAQQSGEHDTAWFAAYVPASATSKPVVVVVTVEQGGFGGVAAAPVARQILSQWFSGTPGPYDAGTS